VHKPEASTEDRKYFFRTKDKSRRSLLRKEMISAEFERKEEVDKVDVVQEASRTASPIASMPWKVVNRVPILSLVGIYKLWLCGH
jgi:hypothetical protein